MLDRPSGSSWFTRISATQPTVPGVRHARRRAPAGVMPNRRSPCEAVGQHPPVARLEDVQRKRRAGKEDDREREDRKPEGHGGM